MKKIYKKANLVLCLASTIQCGVIEHMKQHRLCINYVNRAKHQTLLTCFSSETRLMKSALYHFTVTEITTNIVEKTSILYSKILHITVM